MSGGKQAVLTLPTEREVARRWWVLPPGSILPLSNGDVYRLRFCGHPGGSSGPDVQDAVFVVGRDGEVDVGETRVGDVEFHVRASDWVAHRHQEDPRYNRVVLHVVLVIDDPTPTLREDGVAVPLCSLYDLAPSSSQPFAQSGPHPQWPCQRTVARLSDAEQAALLLRAGLLRFEQKVGAFVEGLHACDEAATRYDRCLIPALAEGLGYGRDRAFFRAAGLRLVGVLEQLPEPLGRSPWPAPLDDGRLRVLGELVRCYHAAGVWRTVKRLLLPETQGSSVESVLHAVRHLLGDAGLSQARADILICNIFYPFAAAVALLEHDVYLQGWAKELYLLHPGLSSNRITRMMSAQLQLRREPDGSCRQQGLHYVYQQTCREKRCMECIMGRSVL